jgi:type IV pilus assembly protein PilC
MQSFTYKARTSEGVLITGRQKAHHRYGIISSLKQKGYYLICVDKESKIASLFVDRKALGYYVRTKDKAVFTHQLATLLKAGMKLTMALDTLSKQTQNKYLVSAIKQMQSDIEQSSSLSEAMSKHPKAFSKVYTAIIGAAEQSGSLTESLSILSNQLKSQASVHAKIKSALVYPIFLLLVSALVVSVLTSFVIPKFIELFVSSNQTLPLPTKILVLVTNSLRDFWWFLMIFIVGLVCLLLTALKNKNFKMAFDSLMLQLPLLGTLNKKMQLGHFSRTLGSLLNGGLTIIHAVNITKSITTNTAFATEITNIEQAIVKGSTMAEAVREQKHFNEIAANMIAVGENTGTLPEMLTELADMQDQESESAISSLTSLLGPMMIVFLGLIIGFIVLAILMPIFETSTIIS